MVNILSILFVTANNTSNMHAECNKQDKVRYQKSIEKIFSLILDELRIDMNQIAYDIMNNKADPTMRLHDLMSEKYAWIKWVPIPATYHDTQVRHFLTEKMHIGKAETNKNTFEWVIPIEIIANGTCHSGKIIFGVMNRYIKEKIDGYLLDQDMFFIILDEAHDPIFLYNDDQGEDFIARVNEYHYDFFRFNEYPLFLYSSDHYHASKYMHLSVELCLVIAIVIFLHSIVYWILSNTLKTLSQPLDKKNLPTYSYIHEIDLILVRIRELTQHNIHNKITIQNLLILNEELKMSQESVETTCKRLRHLLEEAIADRDACMIINKTMDDRLKHANDKMHKNMLGHRHEINFVINVLHEVSNKIEANINCARHITLSQAVSDESSGVMRNIEYRNKVITCFMMNIIALLKINIGDLRLNLERVDLLGFINGCVETIIYPSVHYNVKISHSVADNIRKVLLDKTHMQLALSGLLDSIIKIQKNTFVEIGARNTGDGILMEIICNCINAEIREDLFHADSINTIETFLYITSKIVGLHHGKLTCISDEEGRSSIIIKIPINK